MVSLAQWNGVLVADPSAECAALRKSQVVGIRRAATANQTRVLGDSFDVIAVTDSTRFRKAARFYRPPLFARDVLPSQRSEWVKS